MNTYVKTNGELYHHGVLGQKWGKRNGPPYPLKPSAHSASEKKAGWTKSVSGDANKKKAKIGGFKEFATRNDPIVKWEQKRKAEKEAKNSQNTGGISARDLARAEASSRRKTKNAAERYKKAEADLKEKRANKDNSPESREAVRSARAEKREAEKRAKEQLRADKGRELYAKGLTVEKLRKRGTAAAFALIGADYIGRCLISQGNTKAGVITMAAGTAAWAGYEAYLGLQMNKLRAYYANS